DQLHLLAGGHLDHDRRAEMELVIERVLVVNERALLAERTEDLLRALFPRQAEDLRDVRLNGGDEDRFAEDFRLTSACARDRLDTGRLGSGGSGLNRDRREVVLCRDRVVGSEELIDGATE